MCCACGKAEINIYHKTYVVIAFLSWEFVAKLLLFCKLFGKIFVSHQFVAICWTSNIGINYKYLQVRHLWKIFCKEKNIKSNDTVWRQHILYLLWIHLLMNISYQRETGVTSGFLENEQWESSLETLRAITIIFGLSLWLFVSRSTSFDFNMATLYQCGICEKSFAQEMAMQVHKTKMHERNEMQPVKCPKCDKTFKNRRNYLAHNRDMHRTHDRVRCDICEKSFATKKIMKNHKRLTHHEAQPAQPAQCTICDKTFPNKRYLHNHTVRKHRSHIPVKCEVCDKVLSNKYDLYHHKWLNHRLSTVQCTICDKTLQNKCHLKVHMKNMHQPSDPVKCKFCQKEFKNSIYLSTHINNVHLKKFVTRCHICDKEFSCKARMLGHVRSVHEKERPFECEVCNFKFTDRGSRARHIKFVHEKRKEALVTCSVCQKSFAEKRKLELHVNSVHLELKPFECKFCGIRVSQRGSLNTHIKRFHSETLEQKLQCAQCDRKYESASKLVSHIEEVHEISTRMHKCDRQFSSKRMSRRTVNHVHQKPDLNYSTLVKECQRKAIVLLERLWNKTTFKIRHIIVIDQYCSQSSMQRVACFSMQCVATYLLSNVT